jgi:uncharacterized BrkB/YihY/UPF0761 family membrane protein
MTWFEEIYGAIGIVTILLIWIVMFLLIIDLMNS